MVASVSHDYVDNLPDIAGSSAQRREGVLGVAKIAIADSPTKIYAIYGSLKSIVEWSLFETLLGWVSLPQCQVFMVVG